MLSSDETLRRLGRLLAEAGDSVSIYGEAEDRVAVGLFVLGGHARARAQEIADAMNAWIEAERRRSGEDKREEEEGP